jgi:hypothetical protein
MIVIASHVTDDRGGRWAVAVITNGVKWARPPFEFAHAANVIHYPDSDGGATVRDCVG